MLLKRLYHDSPANASHLIGCHATGQAVVVDPNCDVGPCLAAAAGHPTERAQRAAAPTE